MSEIKKPLPLEMEEAAEEITKAICDTALRHNLSFYFVEKIMYNINAQIAAERQKELLAVKAAFAAAQAKKAAEKEDSKCPK